MDRGPDHVLMDRVREGDREAYRALVERYWAPLLAYVAGMLENEDSAQDIVQETFIRVWRQRSTWKLTGTVSAYLYRITRNLALNWERDRHAELARRERGGKQALSRAPSAGDPQRELEAEALRAEVEAAVTALPERRREVFVLSRFHGLSYQEIAETMGIAPQTVANQMRAALAELRIALANHLDTGR